MRSSAPRIRARIPVLVALTAVTLVASCTAEAPPLTSEPPAYTAPPLPAQAVTVPADTPAVPPQTCGDPTASLRPTGAGAAARGRTLDAIRARGRLIVGLDTGSNLFSFRDPISGVVVGFDADIAREVARDLLGSPDLIEYHTLSSAEREEALAAENPTVDMVVKTMTVNCERRKKLSFSTVYLLAHQRVLAVKDSGVNSVADLANKRVCVLGGTTSLNKIRTLQPLATIVTVPTWADCLVVLQQRQVDAVSTDDAILLGLASQDPWAELVGGPISDEPYGIGIPKGDDDLVRFVNGTLERLRSDGTWTALYNHWLPALGPTPAPPPAVYED